MHVTLVALISAQDEDDPPSEEIMAQPDEAPKDCSDLEWDFLPCTFDTSCCLFSAFGYYDIPGCRETEGEKPCCNSEYKRFPYHDCNKVDDPTSKYCEDPDNNTDGISTACCVEERPDDPSITWPQVCCTPGTLGCCQTT